MNIWQYLHSRVVTGEDDRVLCMGFTDSDIQGHVDYNAPSGLYNLIVATGICNNYKPIERFNALKQHLADGALLVIAENIVGAEDAWLNALIAALKEGHIRFPRVEELINTAAEAGFELREFIKREQEFAFELGEKRNIIMQHVESFSAEAADRLMPDIDGDRLSFMVSCGYFVFEGS